MAKFEAELPNDLMKQLEALNSGGADEMMDEMLTAAAETVIGGVEINARKAFKNPDTVTGNVFVKPQKRRSGLKMSKVYRIKKDDAKSIKIKFVGYKKGSAKTQRYPKGTPIALIAIAREYGTSRGEKKRPFFRPAFNKSEIENTMRLVQKKYIPED